MRKVNDIKIVPLDNDKNKKLMTNPCMLEKNISKLSNKKGPIFTGGASVYKKREGDITEDEKKYLKMSNFQLNNLEYLEAYKYDKRNFFKVYLSVLFREHIILFTFVSRND